MSTTTVGGMTPNELREFIEGVVEQKLLEMLSDPDQGLELNDEVMLRLRRQQKEVAEGERGISLETVLQQLGMN